MKKLFIIIFLVAIIIFIGCDIGSSGSSGSSKGGQFISAEENGTVSLDKIIEDKKK